MPTLMAGRSFKEEVSFVIVTPAQVVTQALDIKRTINRKVMTQRTTKVNYKTKTILTEVRKLISYVHQQEKRNDYKLHLFLLQELV